MDLYRQAQALIAASAAGTDLGAPLAADPFGMPSPALWEAEAAVSLATMLGVLLEQADVGELTRARASADGDPMLRDMIDAELDRRRGSEDR